MNCKKCDSELVEGSKFCNNCGEKVSLGEIELLVKNYSSFWYTLGNIDKKKNKKFINEMKKIFKRDCSMMFNWLIEFDSTLERWKNGKLESPFKQYAE